MVSVKQIDTEHFIINLSPNSSLIGVNRVIFLSSIFILCIGIGITFYFFGASLILPFAGIEIILLFLAFYISFQWSKNKERIFISKEKVKIEKGKTKMKHTWEEFRSFVTFNISNDDQNILRLSFRSKGHEEFIGDFLNEDDKNYLKDEITNIIESLNELSFESLT